MLLGLNNRWRRMNIGKTLFAQVMEHMPWKNFGRIINRYRGDAGVRILSCADLFRVMAFAQLTWRESLRDIEVCLSANQSKLFHMGMKGVPARSTLADALNLRDWAPFRTTKAAVKMHTLLDLHGSIAAFIRISDGKMGDVKVLDILPLEAGAFYVMDRGYVDFARRYQMHQAGAFFVTLAKRGMNARRVYSSKTDRSSGVVCDQAIAMNGFYIAKDYPEHLRRIRLKYPESGRTLVFLTNNTTLAPLTIAALYKNRWQVELFFKWIKQHLRIKRFLGTSKNAVKM